MNPGVADINAQFSSNFNFYLGYDNNHGQFVSGVSQLTNALKAAGYITGAQKAAIQSCAAGASIP